MHVRRARARLSLTAAAAIATGAILAVSPPHPAGPPGAWTGTDLALGAAWVVALAAAIWLAAVASVCTLTLRTRRASFARGTVARWSPSFVRRLVEVAIAGSVVLAVAPPAVATTPGTRPPTVAIDEPVVRTPVRVPAPTTRPPGAAVDEPVVRTPTAAVPPVTPVPTPTPPPTVPNASIDRHHVVRRGDNLWRIARAELVARGTSHPTNAATAQYWQRVITANRATLRSGNPSLIFPGEIVALPEPG